MRYPITDLRYVPICSTSISRPYRSSLTIIWIWGRMPIIKRLIFGMIGIVVQIRVGMAFQALPTNEGKKREKDGNRAHSYWPQSWRLLQCSS